MSFAVNTTSSTRTLYKEDSSCTRHYSCTYTHPSRTTSSLQQPITSTNSTSVLLSQKIARPHPKSLDPREQIKQLGGAGMPQDAGYHHIPEGQASLQQQISGFDRNPKDVNCHLYLRLQSHLGGYQLTLELRSHRGIN